MGIGAFCLLQNRAKELQVRMGISQRLKEFPANTADWGVSRGLMAGGQTANILYVHAGKLTVCVQPFIFLCLYELKSQSKQQQGRFHRLQNEVSLDRSL